MIHKKLALCHVDALANQHSLSVRGVLHPQWPRELDTQSLKQMQNQN